METVWNEGERLLVSQLRQGDQRAFRALFDRYYQEIFSYSVGILKNRELAEENVQDVFLKIWTNCENLDETKSFRAFLYTISRNQAFNLLKKAALDKEMAEEIFFTSQTSAETTDYILRENEAEQLERQALQLLSQKRMQIFEMSRKQGKSHEEISRELGISVQTVKNQMSKALESMRIFFQAHDGYI